MSAYRGSSALVTWQTVRHANVAELRRAHAVLAHGRNLTAQGTRSGGHQINEALILRVVTEFQGFIRDLLDLAAVNLVRRTGSAVEYHAHLTAAISGDRWIDRGNPHLGAIGKDLARLGLAPLGSRLSTKNARHAGDARLLSELIELRNALAHDDRDKVLDLSRRSVAVTIQYLHSAYACLDRYAHALDMVVWEHLNTLFPAVDPWSP